MPDWRSGFAQPQRLGAGAWAEARRRWPDGTPFHFGPTPYVREVLEAIDDPGVEEVTVVKPARAGFTESVALNLIGHAIDHDPRDVLLVVPSLEMTTAFGARKLRPFLAANPHLAERLDDGGRSDALTEKSWAGGSLRIVGAGSARSFRMISAGLAIGDDVDGWDSFAGRGAGNEGCQVTLIRRRTDTIADRKLVWISTPTREGSRIESLYDQADARGAFHVPCPECGEFQVPTWDRLRWEGARVWYECGACGAQIPESCKAEMAAAGRYLDEAGQPVLRPGARSLGFWLRGSLFVPVGGKEWPRLAREWRLIERDTTKRRAFVNTILAESWEERGAAPPWEALYARREDAERGVCPAGVRLLTAGGDLQQNRIEVHVWGWGEGGECWPVEHFIILRDTPGYWSELSALLDVTYPHEDGGELHIERLAFDSGNETELVKGWQRRAPDPRVMLIKGSANARAPLLGKPPRGGPPLVWEVGVNQAKHLLYDALGLPEPLDGEPYPPGYVHLPRWWTDDLVRQLTAEVFDTTPDPRGFPKNRWTNPHQRRNEALDCAVYARIAAEPHLARGRFPEREERAAPVRAQPPQRTGGGWIERRGGGWLR